MGASYAIQVMSSNLALRAKTDRKMGFFFNWILLPIVTFGIWGIVVLYRLIERRDEHFRREARLNQDMLQAIKAKLAEKGVDPYSIPEMATLESTIREKEMVEQPKNPVLWLILSILTGIAGIYVMYFLLTDYFHHEQRQIEVVQKANMVLARADVPTAYQFTYREELPERHFWHQLLASMVTLGIYGIVTGYRLSADPNRHFENQWEWEDSLGRSLSQM